MLKKWFCHIVVLVRSSESMNMHLCLTEFVSYVPEKFSPSVCLLEESSFHTSLCKLQRFKARSCRNLSVSGDECGTILQKDARTSECSIINKKNPLLSGEGLKQSSFRSEVAI